MKANETVERLLQRYMSRTDTVEERAIVENWLYEHVAQPEYDAVFRRLLDATPAESENPTLERIRRRLERLLSATSDKNVRHFRRLRRIISFAAAAILLGAVLLAYLRPTVQTEWHEIYAALGETREMTLPDGTHLWLNSGSRVFYPERFEGKERRIRVDGEVFADVAKDRRHPFIVSAPDVEVRVLGTQFSLKSYAENPNAEVVLIEGSITMRTENSGKHIDYTLTPGDMLRYNRITGSLETYRIDTETFGSWHSARNLCFVNQPLSDIAADLERRFNVKIIIESPELAAMQYYASFVNNESLDRILRALNSNGVMRISRMNGTILITPN